MADYIELLQYLQNDDFDSFKTLMSAEANNAKFVISFLNATDQDLDDIPTVALSPIQMAAQSKDTRILQYLIDLAKKYSEKIDLGALINKPIFCKKPTEINGKSYRPKQNALHLAVKTKNTEIVKLLLSQQSKTPIDINAQDDDGNTPLHLAAANNDLEMVKVLLAHDKINLDIRNKEWKTPGEATSISSEDTDRKIKELLEEKKPKSVIADSNPIAVSPGNNNHSSSTPARAISYEHSSGNASVNSRDVLNSGKRVIRPFILAEHMQDGVIESSSGLENSNLIAETTTNNKVTPPGKPNKAVAPFKSSSVNHGSNNNKNSHGRSERVTDVNYANLPASLPGTTTHTEDTKSFKKLSEKTESKSAWVPLYNYTIGAYINWRNKFTPAEQLALNILVCAIIGSLIGLLFFGVGSAFGAAIGAEVGAAMGLSTATAVATTSAAVAGSVTAGAATGATCFCIYKFSTAFICKSEDDYSFSSKNNKV